MGWIFNKGKDPDIDIDANADVGFTLPGEDIDLSEPDDDKKPLQNTNSNKPKPRHALTPDEVLGKDTEKQNQVWETSQIPMAGGKTVEVNSATVLLYKRMMESKSAAEKKADEAKQKSQTGEFRIAPSPAAQKTDDTTQNGSVNIIISAEPKTDVDKHISGIIKSTKTPPTQNITKSPAKIEIIKTPVEPKAENPVTITSDDTKKIQDSSDKKEQPKKEIPSLLSRCMPYIIDDNGHDHSEDFPPKYTLQSVEDIISSFENKAAQKVSEIYGDRVHTQQKVTTPQKSLKVRPQHKKATPTAPAQEAPAKLASDIPMSNTKTAGASDTANSIKTYQSSFSTIEIPVTTSNNGGDSTITFDINDIRRATGSDLGSTKQIVISDIGEEKKDSIKEFIAPKSADFDEIIDDLSGYTCYDDAKRIRKGLYKTKRNSLIKLVLTALITLAVTVIRFDVLSEAFSGKANIVFAVSTVALALMCIINFKAVLSVADIKKGCKNPHIPVGLAVIAVLLHSLLTLIFFDAATVLNLIPVAGLALVFSALGDFLRAAEVVDNFRYIATPHQKNAVDIIKDPEVSGKIIKTGIDSKPYIVAPRKTVNLLGFLKASNAENAIASKIPLFTLVSGIAALIIGIICFFVLDNISAALSALVIVLCIACPPSTMLIGSLPTKSASARLNANDAMICGYESAMSIEPANCVVVNASDLFPAGSIELINMKILGNNSLDKTFLDAASITLSAQSPLYNVFKDITKSLGDVALPYCDSVKYEDKMGVSGWVDDRHIFIGNRTLLEAHSIAVPSIEVDKKILKKGFFPIYVACNGAAYALLMVRYIPKKSIKQQIMRLACMGVTFYLNSSDPNINTQMVTDYFELFDESVYLLKSDEIKNFKDAVNYKESCFAPACFKGNINGLFSIIAESIKLKTCVSVMTALHIIGAVAGIFALLFAVFASSFATVTVTAIIIWQLAATLISLFALFIK